ncbi:Ubiquitin-like protein [Phytophthora boehmeriae]|uniref:Ubiquitin-like protein n=1 Tax=Phytophthora boehmeriae TaxID=109152 RepID=A0A8T1WVI4_9STRA|nr:Ubiquitin-like protein [Phytophthora boehmeriae]
MADVAAVAAPDATSTRPVGPTKVTLQFVAVGNAPLMKRTKFTVYKFLRKQLRLKDTDSLFVYCNSSFAPSPDQRLSSLFESFQVGDVLVLNYSLTQAWG